MKLAVATALVAAVFASTVNAHGQMTEPAPREVTDKYRADSGALKNAGKDELQWAPLENLSQRVQADFPQAATFDMMNGCRGMVYEASSPVTALKAGVAFPVKWYIQAPHPGYAEFSIVKPKTGAGGKIKYEKVALLKRIEDFATRGGNDETTLTIPASVTGCETAGACALQMYWHSDIAKQTYPTCADITIGGSGAGADTPPAADGSEDADGDADDNDEYPAETPAPATTKPVATKTPKPATGTTTPVVTPKPAAGTPAPTKKKCTRRMRQ